MLDEENKTSLRKLHKQKRTPVLVQNTPAVPQRKTKESLAHPCAALFKGIYFDEADSVSLESAIS